MQVKKLKDALLDAWDSLLPLVGFNFTWVILTVLVIPAFPAYAGLHVVTNQIAHGTSPTFGDFFQGFKKYFWVSLKYGFLNLVIYVLVVLNLRFYAAFEGTVYILLQGFFVAFTVVWTIVQMYVFPFILEQKEKSIKTALQNSGAVCIRFPGRTLGLFVFFIGFAIVSTLLPPVWVLLSFSLMAYLANWQTISAIRILKVQDGVVDADSVEE